MAQLSISRHTTWFPPTYLQLQKHPIWRSQHKHNSPCCRHIRKFGTMTSCYQTNLIVFQFRGVTRPFLCRGLLCLRAHLFRLTASAASFILFASARLSPTLLLLLSITNKSLVGTGDVYFLFVMFRCHYEFGMLPSVGARIFVLSCPFLPTI